MAISRGVISEVLISLDLDVLVWVSAHGHQVRDTLHVYTHGNDIVHMEIVINISVHSECAWKHAWKQNITV